MPQAAHLDVTTYRHPDLDAAHPAHLRRDPALDGLRGLAILLIFFFNYGANPDAHTPLLRGFNIFCNAGWIGLVLFFTLSGFLITGILWDTLHPLPVRHGLRNFFARRALRLLPLYYFALFLCAFVSVADGGRFEEIQPLLYSIFFLQALPGLGVPAQQGWITLPVYHLWPIALDVYFYLLLPLALFLCRSREVACRVAISAFAASCIFRPLLWLSPLGASAVRNHAFDETLLQHGGAFALGAALALAVRSPHVEVAFPRIARLSRWAFLAGIAIFAAVSLCVRNSGPQPPMQSAFGLTGITVACAGVVAIALQRGPVRRTLSSPGLRFLGRISYGFYIYQLLLQPLYEAIAGHLAHHNAGVAWLAIRFVVAFVLTFALSALSWEFFESPILALKERFPVRHPIPQLPAL